MRVLFAFFLLLNACTNRVPDERWQLLKARMETISQKDQQYRSQIDSVAKAFGWQSKEVASLLNHQGQLDSANLAEMEQLVQEFGFPTKDKVGDAVESAFRIIQRAPDSVKVQYYDMILSSAKAGELPMKSVAFYQDQVLMTRRQPQEFGTQIWIDYKTDSTTGARYDSVFLWEIRDREHVNERRLEAGLDSLETFLKFLDIDPSKGYALRRKQDSKI